MRPEELKIQSVGGSWKTTIARLNALFDGLSGAEFQQQIALAGARSPAEAPYPRTSENRISSR